MIATRADKQPAHTGFKGRVTASMIATHGSYDKARAALDKQAEDDEREARMQEDERP